MGVDGDGGDDDESEGCVVEGVAAEFALEDDAEGGGEGDQRGDDVADFHGVGDEAAEEVSEEGQKGHGAGGRPRCRRARWRDGA